MAEFTTRDGTQIFYKDWGSGQPIVFHHGWPLSADDWDAQMILFLHHGYRVVANDRRGHGRSAQSVRATTWSTTSGPDRADEHLDLRNAVHIGHSTGGGEVARYVARYGKAGPAKAVLVGAVTPTVVQTDANPEASPRLLRRLPSGALAATGPNSTEPWRPVLFTDSTVRASRPPRRSSRTGGDRA